MSNGTWVVTEIWYDPATMQHKQISYREPGNEPPTHDFSGPNRRWGHDYTVSSITPDGVRISGWGRGLQAGDYLILDGDYLIPDEGAAPTTRYRIEHIDYCMNPPDMWHAQAFFAPRPRNEEDIANSRAEAAPVVLGGTPARTTQNTYPAQEDLES